MNDFRILIVDDEEDLAEILQFNLEGEGYIADVAHSAEQALKKDLAGYDLILLDVMMGEMSGFKLAKILRRDHKLKVPIIFITARTAEDDILTGFNLGGDDYITKPFSIKEIVARVKAVLKRSRISDESDDPVIAIDKLVLNLQKREASIKGKVLKLTKKEFEILKLLVTREGKIFSRNDIIERVWDEKTIVTERTVDVHLTRLRKKLGDVGKMIRNRQGYGYVFEKNN